MAYAGMGDVNTSWVEPIRAAFAKVGAPGMRSLLARFLKAHGEGADSTPLYSALGKNFAATVQRSFEVTVLEVVTRQFQKWIKTVPTNPEPQLVVSLTGGCALSMQHPPACPPTRPQARPHTNPQARPQAHP